MTVNPLSETPAAVDANASPSEPVATTIEMPTLPEGIRVLVGHTSMETAYVQPDYPYGRLRCERRVWVESKKKEGQRFCAQTCDPKRGRWNAPKKSTYSALVVMTLDERKDSAEFGYVHLHSLNGYAEESEIDRFEALYGAALQDEFSRSELRTLRALARANKKVVWTVGARPADGEPGAGGVQTPEEQRRLWGKVVGSELRALEAQS